MAVTEQAAQAPEKLLMTRAEAAYALNMSERQLDYMREKGIIKVRMHGRKVLIPTTEVRRISRMDIIFP